MHEKHKQNRGYGASGDSRLILPSNISFDFLASTSHVPRVNLATKAPNFTPETARLMAIRSQESRRLNIQREKEAFEAGRQSALNEKTLDDEARRTITLQQIDKLDQRINEALADDDEERFLKLTGAKERLWKLVAPTAGVLKPKRAGEASRRPSAVPVNVQVEPPVSNNGTPQA